MDNDELRGLLAKATQTYGERQALVIRGKDHVAINRARHDFELAAAALMPDMPRLLADSDELAKLRAEIAGACEWTFDLDSEAWDSACGEKWQFTHDGPAENNVRFCHGCGKPVALLRLPAGESQDTTTRAQGEG